MQKNASPRVDETRKVVDVSENLENTILEQLGEVVVDFWAVGSSIIVVDTLPKSPFSKGEKRPHKCKVPKVAVLHPTETSRKKTWRVTADRVEKRQCSTEAGGCLHQKALSGAPAVERPLRAEEAREKRGGS